MEFSEAFCSWRSVPAWASCLIEFGYAWRDQPCDSRRIAAISMPSDSAAAGLVALGVMRKCLELDHATDVNAHYARLHELAMTRSNDIELRHERHQGLFIFDGVEADGRLRVTKQNADDNRCIIFGLTGSLKWHINGESQVRLHDGQQIPNGQIYAGLLPHGGAIKPSNLSESYSQVCLAGCSTGEAPTKEKMAKIRFRHDGEEADLSQLLTVQSWLPGTISRMLFYNSRTDKFDRQTGSPKVVIADGDTSFLKVIDRNDFKESDVIGIVHRTMEREKLETISRKLESIRQWYKPISADGVSDNKRGIGIYALKRR